MIPYGHQHIDAEDIRAVVSVLRSDWLTQGPKIQEFERALREYCGARYAVVFSSGTAALHGAYCAAGLKPGDEFITSPLTFAATANAGLYLGAKPVFADIDANGNVDPKKAEERITKKTKLLSIVDYAGHPADLGSFKKLAKKYTVALVEDACHALGASYNGKKIGSWSDMTVFSFHPVKSITTGEGGAVLTNKGTHYEKLKMFRNHGITQSSLQCKSRLAGDWYSEMQALGFNYRLTDVQAALGISQLKKLDRFIQTRRDIASYYAAHLALLGDRLDLPLWTPGVLSAWHLYVIRVKDVSGKERLALFNKLRGSGIGVQVHYLPVYWHPYYRKLGYKKGSCPAAESFYESVISLPIFPGLRRKDQHTIITVIKDILRHL